MAEQTAKQMQLQRLIERALDNFKKLGRSNWNPPKIRSRISSLKETWILFLNGHATLMKLIPEASRASVEYFKEGAFEATEDAYQTALDYMTEQLEVFEPPVSPQNSFNVSNLLATQSSLSVKHLPPISLPSFDGSFDRWESFRDRFTALIIQNRELTNFSRMHFLMSSVTGRARESLGDIAVTADNFETAWTSLTARYENKRRLISGHFATLLNLPAISRESAADISSLHDKVNVAVTALMNLKRTSEQLWNDMLVHIVTQKLDSMTRKSWTLRSKEYDELPSFEDLTNFLLYRARALEECSFLSASKSTTRPASKVIVATASTSEQYSCPICKERHMFSACPKFACHNSTQRRELVKKHRRCFNCLSEKHSVKDCKSKYACRFCQRKHHSMLHLPQQSSATSERAEPRSGESLNASPTGQSCQPINYKHEVNSLNASPQFRKNSQILLATAWVRIRVASGRSIAVRALLDQGSEVTFISENIAQMLRANRIRMPVAVSAVGGVHAGTCRYATEISISPIDSLTPSVQATALIMKTLTSYAPERIEDFSPFADFSGLIWADSNPMSSVPINVIIGADLYNEVILDGVRRARRGGPLAQNTIFGWVLSGPITANALSNTAPRSSYSFRASVNHCLTLPSLEDEIKKFWELEELPRKVILSAEEEKCENHFRATHSRAIDGRYIVRLPFKTKHPIDIGCSRNRAEKLLMSLSRRLSANPEHANEYATFLTEYEQLGHMREVPTVSSGSREQPVYIPHHPVFREGSATTHLRVVFNASSMTSNGSSLNDHLLSGPKLQLELPAVILRWRQLKFVYTADIAKMYRQILVDQRDIDFQRILWAADLRQSPTEYQLLTVTYGMTCAPFLALRVIKQLEMDEGAKFPLAANILRNNMYVDDVLFGSHDPSLLRKTRDQLIDLLRRGGFDLRKWASNSPDLLADIDSSNHGLACKSFASDETLKILGIRWSPSEDAFQFTVSIKPTVPTSKRSILSAIAKLYDPLGWVTPVVITAKIFMQNLWRENVQWDDDVPQHLLERWKLIYSNLSNLDGLRLARWTGAEADIQYAEMHGFADASNVAYGAAVYLKIISRTGKVTVSLLAGKSRVAPLTPLSIPRLELSAAVLLARLLEFVRSSLDLNELPTFCWSDSTVVLAWLRQHPSTWKTFVANRVTEVQNRLPHVTWGHVATEDNPADCASRGLLGAEICEHPLWWHGPAWLLHPRDAWPRSVSFTSIATSLEKKIVTVYCVTRDPLDLATRWSSWSKMIRVIGYILRFIARCRRVKVLSQNDFPPLALTAAEYSASKVFVIRRIQSELFPAERSALSNGKPLSSKSPILSLAPILDGDGIIRVGGRLRNAPLPRDARQPMLLAAHPVARLIIDHTHKRALHSGLQLTLSILRREYWILRARTLVRSVIRGCVVCTREKAATPAQMMSDLPAVRVTTPSRSFAHCGLDYAGPILIRASAGRGISTRKAYIVLFICMASRAVHLELVSDYSTSAFTNAFSRFCARRGLPQSIYSDNGTTFIGAERDLTTAYRSAIRDSNFQNSIASDRVSWHFLPPAAPHFGGLWEAGVKSVKHHLRRVLGPHKLTFEEFSTLLCRIEACLNSRPLAPLTDTLDELDPLTPGHFLVGSAITVPPEASTLDIQENRLSRWQLVRQITERFWKVWSSDYVNTLQQRSKWRTVQPNVPVGKLVLLKNPLLPPCKWELGRVTQCHPGDDGLTRVVTIKTARSAYKRPIVKLCVLPVDATADQ